VAGPGLDSVFGPGVAVALTELLDGLVGEFADVSCWVSLLDSPFFSDGFKVTGVVVLIKPDSEASAATPAKRTIFGSFKRSAQLFMGEVACNVVIVAGAITLQRAACRVSAATCSSTEVSALGVEMASAGAVATPRRAGFGSTGGGLSVTGRSGIRAVAYLRWSEI